MRQMKLLLPVAVRIAATIAFFSLMLHPTAFAATFYVSNTGGGSGTTPGSPTTLQAALTAAQGNGEADTIYLLAGSYPTSGGPFSYNASQSDEVRLTGGWNAGFTTQYRGMDPASMTALNGQNLNRVLEIRSEAAGVALKFTIENTALLNGLANVNGIHGAGLRSNCANGGTINLIIKRCLFDNNNGVAGATNASGGGLFTNGYAEIYDTVFSNNRARSGGGIHFYYVAPFSNATAPLVERCTFTNNKSLSYSCCIPEGTPPCTISTCYDGGGDIFSRVSPIIRSSTISGDRTLSGGGAIDHGYGGNLRLINSTISGKRSWFWGGGIHIWDANAEIYNSLIFDNAAGQSGVYGRGGGLAIFDPTPPTPPTPANSVKVFNSTFVKNGSNGTLDNLVGKAIDNRVQALTVYNSIFWDNGTADQFPIFTSAGGTASVNYSDYQYGWTGSGGNNINLLPDFVDFNNNDFHLNGSSPCRDSGDDTPSPANNFLKTFYPTSSDRDGRDRIIGGLPDMGAYEFDTSPFAHAVGRGDPNLAYDPGNNRYLAVYNYLDGTGGGRLHGRLINPDGTPLAAEFPISEQKSYKRMISALAYDAQNNKFVTVWDAFNASSNDMDIQGQLVNPDGTLDGWNFNVSNKAGVEEYGPAIAYEGATHQTFVVWTKHLFPTDDYDAYGRLFLKDLAQGADEIPIANAASYAEAGPAVAFNPVANQFLVVWVDDRFYNTHVGEIFGKRFDTSGNPVGSDMHISGTGGNAEGGDQVKPNVAFNPTAQKFLVAWEDGRNGNPDIYGRVIDHNGGLPGNTFPISIPASDQTYPTLAFDSQNKRFLAVWQDDRNAGTNGADLYGQWFDPNGMASGPNFAVLRATDEQKFPKVAFGAGSFLAAYEINYTSGPVTFDAGFKQIQGSGFLFLPLILR